MRKLPFFGPEMDFSRSKNKLVNKYQEVRGQLSTTFSKAPNSGLTADEKFFVLARLILASFQFQCQSFLLSHPLF